jgi:uncharacterized protein YtpQ (UPF0354 family)
MNPLEHVAATREKYIEGLRKVIREKKAVGEFLGAEVVLEGKAETREAQRFCADVMTGTVEKQSVVMVANEAPEGPLVGAVPIDGIEASIFAYAWESCRIWFRVASLDRQAIDGWFEQWSGGSDSRQVDEDGLSGVVHFMSPLIPDGHAFAMEVDFGSAPVEAFIELLKMLSGMGATEVRVGISDGSELDERLGAILQSPNLTPEQFMEVVAELIRGQSGVTLVERSGELELKVHKEGAKDPSRSYLFNLWKRLQRVPPEARAKEVLLHVRVHDGAHGADGTTRDKPDLAQLRPLIRDAEFLRQIRQQTGKEEFMMRRKLMGDLSVFYAWDELNGMRYVLSSEPGEYEMDTEAFHQRAIANYLRYRNPVQTQEQEGVSILRTADCYDATLLLDEEFWKKRAKTASGDVLVCAPTRDFVLATATKVMGGEKTLRKIAAKLMAGGDHLISGTVLRWTKTGWKVHLETASNASEIRPAVLRKSQPIKKPWWKFW